MTSRGLSVQFDLLVSVEACGHPMRKFGGLGGNDVVHKRGGWSLSGRTAHNKSDLARPANG